MFSVFSLWLPILLSAVGVFILSSIIHLVLTYHKSDFGKVPEEDTVRDALRKLSIPPGEYFIPRAFSMKEMSTPEYTKKLEEGPIAYLTVEKNGQQSMAKGLVHWFIYSIIVGFFAAYIATRSLGLGADYITVFRVVGTTTFLGYSMALAQNSIWYKRKWSTTLKSMFDGAIYAAFTGGIFGWLWPV